MNEYYDNKPEEKSEEIKETPEKPENGTVINNDNGDVAEPDTDNLKETTSDEKTSEMPAANDEYIYKWDYSYQKKYDEEAAKKSKINGTKIYAVIMTCAFAVAIILLCATMILDNAFASINKTIFIREYDSESGYLTTAEIAEKVSPSVVSIFVTTETGQGIGSGIILSEDGYISTNYHVIEGAETITAIHQNGEEYEATLIGGNKLNDLAVIKISAKNLKPATFGDSDAVVIGEDVVAIGTPASIEYKGTVTKGVVSYVNRVVSIYNDNGTLGKKLNVIQFDATVNPGNSGGPLIDSYGKVIGVISMKLAGNYANLGFALPMNGALEIINDIIEHGEIQDGTDGNATQGAALGISGSTISKGRSFLRDNNGNLYLVGEDEDGKEYIVLENYAVVYVTDEMLDDYRRTISEHDGVIVSGVTEGFDAYEKLALGDIIVEVDGEKITIVEEIRAITFNKNVGDSLNIKLYRDGELISVNVILGSSEATS